MLPRLWLTVPSYSGWIARKNGKLDEVSLMRVAPALIKTLSSRCTKALYSDMMAWTIMVSLGNKVIFAQWLQESSSKLHKSSSC